MHLPSARSFVLKSSRLENISSFSTLSSSLHSEASSLGLNEVDGDQGNDQISSQGHRMSGERYVILVSNEIGSWPFCLNGSHLSD